MKTFEYISNLIGKRVLHILFILSVFLECKACASYLLYAKENFQCPLCEIIKGVRSNKIHVYSLSAKVIIPDYKDEVQCKPLHHENIFAQQQSYAINNKGYVQVELPVHLVRIYEEYTEIQNRLFIKYHQLKISPFFYVQKPVNDLQYLTT